MITNYQLSAVIGLWRMGNPDTVIAMILELTVWEVERIIKLYQNN